MQNTFAVGGVYGSGSIYVENGPITVATNGSAYFKTNTIEATDNAVTTTLYSALTNTLNIGNSSNSYNVNMYGRYAFSYALIHQATPAIPTGVIWDFLNSSGTRRGWINGSSSSAVAYVTSSDRRLKTNIETLPSQIDNIKMLNARKYKWIESNEDGIGFIYQEVKEIFPDFDDKEDDSKYHGLDYGKFTPYLWSGVKELIDRVEKLEETTTQVETKSNDIKIQLDKLDEKVNSDIAQLIITQNNKIAYLENTILTLQKQLTIINDALLSKNIL
jgi:hypothetical protein